MSKKIVHKESDKMPYTCTNSADPDQNVPGGAV